MGKPGAPLREPGTQERKVCVLDSSGPLRIVHRDCPLGSGWFTLKKLPRCTPFERRKLMSSTESLWLEFPGQGWSGSVWRLVIIVEAGDDCIAKEPIRRPSHQDRSPAEQHLDKFHKKSVSAMEVMFGALAKARGACGIEGISLVRPGYGPPVPPQEGCWHASNGMENSRGRSAAATQDNVVLGAKAVSKAGARIELLVLFAQQFGGESFKLVAQAVIQGQIFNRAPVVLQIQAA